MDLVYTWYGSATSHAGRARGAGGDHLQGPARPVCSCSRPRTSTTSFSECSVALRRSTTCASTPFIFMANHFHLLITVLDPEQMSLFTGFLKANLAKELGRLHDWRETFWGRRYHSASDRHRTSTTSSSASSTFSTMVAKKASSPHRSSGPGATSARALYRGESALERARGTTVPLNTGLFCGASTSCIPSRPRPST